MATGKRLGRGLETLLGRIGGAPETETLNISEERIDSTSSTVDVMKIEPNPFQPRKVFDAAELEELAQSLHVHGLMQPIVVRRADGRYQIVAGERRFRAALLLGWSEIAVQFCEADDQQMTELALTENLQRKDLNDIEKAASFANYLEAYPGTTHEELANRLAVKRPTVTNLLRLLKLPKQLQDDVCRGRLDTGHARALLPLKNEWEQIEVAAKIQAEGWNVRETEKFVQDLLQTGEAESPQNPKERTLKIADHRSEQIQQLEDNLRSYLGGVKVKLEQKNEKGKGKLTITFANHAEFEQVYAAICKPHLAVG